jgi:hypothetical protein
MVGSHRALSRALEPVDEGPQLLKIVTESFSDGLMGLCERKNEQWKSSFPEPSQLLCIGVFGDRK